MGVPGALKWLKTDLRFAPLGLIGLMGIVPGGGKTGRGHIKGCHPEFYAFRHMGPI